MNQTELTDLNEAFCALKTPNDLNLFFTDLFTPGELEAMQGRWAVAQLLSQGIAYREVAEKTGVSTATITRVARCLNEGKGYQIALEKVAKKRSGKKT